MMGEQVELDFAELMKCDGMLFCIGDDCIVKIVVNKEKNNFELVYVNKNIPTITFNKNDFHKLYLYKYILEDLGNEYSIVMDK
jgi:hypothetical protein